MINLEQSINKVIKAVIRRSYWSCIIFSDNEFSFHYFDTRTKSLNESLNDFIRFNRNDLFENDTKEVLEFLVKNNAMTQEEYDKVETAICNRNLKNNF